VITCLFLGGNILASKKTSYADAVGAADLAAHVRALMEAQHKDMLRQLVRGAFDAEEARRTERARSFAPGELAVGTAPEEAAPAPPAAAATEPVARGEPPVLPRVARATARPEPARPDPAPASPPPLPAAEPAERGRRLDELVLTYLAGDLGAARGGA
jgi:hypothetical protein